MQKKSLLTIAALLIAFLSPSYAQNGYDFTQFRDETFEFIKQPITWGGNDWLKVGLVGAGTIFVMQADQPMRDAVLRDQSYYNSVPVRFGKFWGETYTSAIAAGIFGLHGILTETTASKKIGFEIVQAALYSGGITTILKAAIGRARPYTNDGIAEYHPFTLFDDEFHSLPSGHTTLAFALSTVLSRNAQSTALKILVYVPAALTAFARVYQDYHWTSDCLLGAAIGYAAATWVVDLHDQKDSPVHLSSVFPLTIRIALD